MSIYSILVTNNAPGCDTEIEQQLTVTGCTSYIVRLASNSNALGPFNIYVDDVLYYANASRNDMFNGIVVTLECVTPTPTPTMTPTQTQTNTPSPGTSPTPTPTLTETPTNTPTQTPTGTPAETPTSTPTETPTNTPTPTETPTNTPTPSVTETATSTPTPTQTPTETPTNTPTNTETPTQTPSETPTNTPTNTETSTPTPTQTPTETPTNTPTNTETPTETPTNTPTNTETPTNTPTETPTNTPTETPTETPTNTPTNTETPTNTPTETPTNTPTETPTNTPTNTETPTNTPTETPTETPTNTPSETPTNTPSETPTNTPTLTQTPTATVQPLFAYLTIEPQAQNLNFNGWMASQGSAFRGFWNGGATTANQVTFSQQFNAYLNYSGWGGNSPAIITGTISPTSGGLDAYNNPINAYLFQTTQVAAGTTPSNAWYTWYVSTGATNGQIMTQIGTNTAGNPNSLTARNLTSGYYNLTVNYTGGTIPPGTYRVYTTYGLTDFRINASANNVYFKGNTLT